jgi:hypothetical protein
MSMKDSQLIEAIGTLLCCPKSEEQKHWLDTMSGEFEGRCPLKQKKTREERVIEVLGIDNWGEDDW